ncbi:PP2C family protein-serine/threonine phosphatase [Variovorax saccharolyticus]|uniref:PP2C family protein-serine/threonine phosphatase n=1 Tax=Variovorax saccharolyticus TaxID=3053516 RepID=UPI00257545BA|nr:PP2C family serine/threonine-protein phosphatase [Variovorax sp. J31P216]MDM0029585.1 serine/threonine-protein phosphatase [Variovorax sp. J31P216]
MARIQLDVHPFTDRGRREHQEDFFYTDPPERDGVPWLGGLADGMGGHACGDVASKAGIHALKQAFDAAVAGRHNTLDALIGAVTEGHQAVLQAAERVKAVGNMGSTIVAFAVEGRTLFWCSAGDSRLYLCRNGRLAQLSRDFTLAEDMRHGVKGGAWSEEDIGTSPQRNALTSFMGTDVWRHDDGKTELQHGDVVVACSDGVYGTIDTDGILAACLIDGGAASAQQIAENMLGRVLAAGRPNQDNSTAVIVRFGASQALALPAAKKDVGRGNTWLIGSGIGLAALALVGLVAYALFPHTPENPRNATVDPPVVVPARPDPTEFAPSGASDGRTGSTGSQQSPPSQANASQPSVADKQFVGDRGLEEVRRLEELLERHKSWPPQVQVDMLRDLRNRLGDSASVQAIDQMDKLEARIRSSGASRMNARGVQDGGRTDAPTGQGRGSAAQRQAREAAQSQSAGAVNKKKETPQSGGSGPLKASGNLSSGETELVDSYKNDLPPDGVK